MKKLYLIYLVLFFIACEKDELPIEKHIMGDIASYQIQQTVYENQIFYNLKSNTAIKENLTTDWDLAFEASEQGWKILINSSRYSDVTEFENYNFGDEITQNEINNAEKKWDNPKGLDYGTAFGNYMQKNSIYVLNRGYNIDGTLSGYKKIFIDSVNTEYYSIIYSDLDNSNTRTIQVPKDSSTNFQYLSINTNSIINLEPNKNDWDLLFTPYTTLYNDPETPPSYLVRGVLTNYLNGVLVAKDSLRIFEDINYDMIGSYIFSNHQNQIGYDWKTYIMNEQPGYYLVNPKISYIIKNISNRYFKLRFIDFYKEGEKGYPKFEIIEL